MKKFMTAINIILLVAVCALILNLFKPSQSDAEIENFRQKQIMELNQKMAEKELQGKIEAADKVIKNIQDNVEIILLTEEGDYTTTLDKNEDKWYNSLADSKITIFCNYKLIYCIDTKDIEFKNNSGTIDYKYNDSDIYLKMVETSNHQVDVKKNLFGKKFSEQEVATIFENVANDIKTKEEVNQIFLDYCKTNLDNFISNICTKSNVAAVTPIPADEIQNNNPNTKRDKTDFIVIHTTNNTSPTATAQAHFNFWNNTPNVNVSANYVVDENEIVKCIGLDKISYGVGTNEWKENQVAFNFNSINIEMCVNDGANFEQTKANTIKFLKDVVIPMYPNAQVIRHFDATGKETCPDMSQVEWDRFIEDLGV